MEHRGMCRQRLRDSGMVVRENHDLCDKPILEFRKPVCVCFTCASLAAHFIMGVGYFPN